MRSIVRFENESIKKATLVDQQGRILDIIEVDNSYCIAQIALQGAQILKFQSKLDGVLQSDLLWCSTQSKYLPNKAIRGGIPLCFPWFGDHVEDPSLPAHGFARNKIWQLIDTAQTDDTHVLTLMLTDDPSTRQLWDYAFKLQLDIHLGQELKLSLHVHNSDNVAWSFGFVWHTYFKIQEILNTKILGLENTAFMNKLDVHAGPLIENDAIVIDQEVDRVYQYASGHYTILENNQASILIRSPKCESAVIWNPWRDKAARLGDVGDTWQQFVCIECGQFGEVEMLLSSGQSYQFDMALTPIHEA